MFFSLRNRLFIIFTFLLTVPLIILSIIIPNWLTAVIKEQTQDLTVEMMDQYALYIDSITTQAEDIGKQVLLNQTTQQLIQMEKEELETQGEAFVMKSQIQAMLSSVMINNSHSMSISIYLNDGSNTWGEDADLQELEWYLDFTEKEKNFITAHSDPYQQSETMRLQKVNSYVVPLVDMNTLSASGLIKVNFPAALLEEALMNHSANKNSHTYLLTDQASNVLGGKIQTPQRLLEQSVSTIKKSSVEKGLLELEYGGENYFVFYQKLPVGDWILLNEVTESNLFSQSQELQKTLLILSTIIFLLTIIASFVLSSTIVQPIGKLAKAMGYIERGDFVGAKKFMPTIKSRNYEVDYLVNVVNHTIEQLKNKIETEYEANIRRKDAEYKALLLQINPHFMNNTLEIIGGLAAQGKNEEVMNVSVYLGRMLRYSLQTKNSVVRLSEEMAYIRSYTEILKLRYEDSLSIQIKEDPQTKNIFIVKFILQPLVENAVKYSFSHKESADILLNTKQADGWLVITIEDKGAGMSEEEVSQLLEFEENAVLQSNGYSIGLKNVLGRLKLYYGEDFFYEIKSEKRKGTKITLCMRELEEGLHDESYDN
ncbi:cache domain-containing sensor histidine kinase [Jeotgalibacillus proteolyticus]|uniref:Sensor histidine kinase n=1 Tax=Jeotgalibacillus proteolyticus TaxID=2082395 RepID=A0A2S5GF84_9BACL|nr:sensor histidine kinase [Jeotgalibacillus proteolyticus]PPA71712.1 sensor histidine kinase [Jeotgalibacillus proteolyticus]